MFITFWPITLVLGLAVGSVAGYAYRKARARQSSDHAESHAQSIIEEAEKKRDQILQTTKTRAQEQELEAKEKAMKIIEEAKSEEQERRQEYQQQLRRLEKRENVFDQKLLEFEDKKNELEAQKQQNQEIRNQLQTLKEQEEKQLETVAGMEREQALEELFQRLQRDEQDALSSRMRKLERSTEEELEQKSRKILSLAITRFSSSVATESTTTSVDLPNDEMKGRIIGKEGRNIKALEMLTGTEIIVDDTPEAIMISGFSPIRRQVAKRALDMLIKDGRIHPARIEEMVMQAKKALATDLRKAGEDALYQLGIPVSSIDPKLISILGRMKYRTSYGQNALQHSIEVGQISGMIAEELGADVFVCKKGGLFHDIGKAVDHDMQGAHPEIGYNIMKRFGFPEEICYQSIAHHEDRPRTIEGAIVKAGDAISGARPGARKQSLEDFIKRMEELERTASAFDGVEKAYAIQAGREVRIFVSPENVDDLSAYQLARDVAKKIESELSYPGEVKVTLIRETRIIEYAR